MFAERSRSTVPLKVAGVLLALLGIFPLAAVIKWAPVISWLPIAGREWAISLTAVVALCLILARAGGERVDALLDGVRRSVMAPTSRDFAIYAGLFTFFASLFVSWFCFGGQPAGGDEMAQRFQARLLMAGRLWGVAEEPFQFVSGIQTVNMDGRWFSQFPIGGPVLLAIGALFGAAWMVNPILAGWTAASVHRFASRITDEATARVATILFATSPFVLLMSGSQMNHVGALAFIMYALVALVDWARAVEASDLRRAALRVGFGFAASAAIRPYDAAAFALVVGVFQLATARTSAAHLRSFTWQVAGAALPLALILFTNAQQTGHPLLFGYDALNGPAHRPGFHADPDGVEFTPVQGIHHVSSYLLLLNVSLFGGPVPSVLLIVAALLLARQATRWDYLVISLIGILLVAYAMYWAESFFVGPRFLYAGVPLFILLAAMLPRSLVARLGSLPARRAARLLIPAAIAVAWILPPGAAVYQGVWSAFVDERRSNVNERIDLDAAAREAGLEEALVIVHESWHGRIAARLRALGAPALTAESMLRELDACGLHVGLDAEERIGGPPSAERVQRVVRRALMLGEVERFPGKDGAGPLAFAVNRPVHPYCAAELQADQNGSVALDRFLAHAQFDREGRLAGRVVYVRDFGAENSKLLSRFGDRTWYRYRPRSGPDDESPLFVPYYR